MTPPEYEVEVVASPETERASKRRKLRKGTTSCWDCKKRKVRCTFDLASETECIACRRRGLLCLSQDQPEEFLQVQDTDITRGPLVDRISRVENLVEELVWTVQSLPGNKKDIDSTIVYIPPGENNTDEFSPPAPVCPLDSCIFIDSRQEHAARGTVNINTYTAYSKISKSYPSTIDVSFPSRTTTISEDLIKAFPPQEIMDLVFKYDPLTTSQCYRMFSRCVDYAEHEVCQAVDKLTELPDPSTTPPIIIARKMIMLALFVQYFRSQHVISLAEKLAVTMDRLIETASRLVTSDESIVACVEGVECIVLEGIFRFNGGNLRRAWLAFRKAMTMAQLMKMDYPNPPHFKPLEPNIAIDANTIWHRIVRMDAHLSLMLGLSHGGQETRMEKEISNETASCKLERVHTLIARQIIDRNKGDIEIQDFTKTTKHDQDLLAAANSLPETFWLPPNFATLRPNTPEALQETMRLCDQIHHYNLIHLLHLPYLLRNSPSSTNAKINCVNASRDILTRVISFRQFNREMATIYCRTADFFALMASMTLLLVHIDAHRLLGSQQDWRAHQRLSDRALVHQLLSVLEEIARNTNDQLIDQSVRQLQRLLDMESDTARGATHSAHAAVSCLEEGCTELRLEIPYFGIINIGAVGDTQASLVELQGEGSDGLREQGREELQFPGLVAGIDDWAFQGVDGAFFDSLMKGNVEWE